MMALLLESSLPTQKNWVKFLAPGFGAMPCQVSVDLGSESVDPKNLFLSPPTLISVTLPFKYMKT